jgi:NAD(P)-dependent dehydrogenase (short-subunit alcohol dehydrogenase family)
VAGELAGKVAIVTGGARGLGQGMVELFVEEGAQVIIADLREEEGTALAETLGNAVRFRKTDISKREEVQALVDLAVAEFGGLHAMVNNAGLTDNSFDSFLDADFAQFESIMAVNVLGAMLGTQIAARHMAANGGGSVINISSISGIHAGFGFFSYRASKAAVVPSEMGAFAHTDGLVDDKAARIKQAVNDTRMNWQPLKRQGNPRDIANATMFLASDRSAQMTGQIIAVDGGATAGDPRSQIADILQARAAAEAEF